LTIRRVDVNSRECGAIAMRAEDNDATTLSEQLMALLNVQQQALATVQG
jgi:hypothetical protein